MYSHARRHLGAVLLVGVGASGLNLAAEAPFAATQQAAVSIQTAGRVACLVSRPPAPTGIGQPDTDWLVVEVRVPDAPSPTALAALPAAERNVSQWPIEIRIEGAPEIPGRAVTAKPRRIVPGTSAPALFLRTPEGGAAMFLRVSYPRAALQAGVQIIAERKVGKRPTAAGTTETRCTITANEVAQWP